jgi:hypothetical protein
VFRRNQQRPSLMAAAPVPVENFSSRMITSLLHTLAASVAIPLCLPRFSILTFTSKVPKRLGYETSGFLFRDNAEPAFPGVRLSPHVRPRPALPPQSQRAKPSSILPRHPPREIDPPSRAAPCEPFSTHCTAIWKSRAGSRGFFSYPFVSFVVPTPLVGAAGGSATSAPLRFSYLSPSGPPRDLTKNHSHPSEQIITRSFSPEYPPQTPRKSHHLSPSPRPHSTSQKVRNGCPLPATHFRCIFVHRSEPPHSLAWIKAFSSST